MQRPFDISNTNILRRRLNQSLLASWAEFHETYPTTKSCLEELVRRSGKNITNCSRCNSPEVELRNGARILKCRACKCSTWLTAGTNYRRIKNPRAWLGAMWLVEHGILISAHKFHELADIAYATAYAISKKISSTFNIEQFTLIDFTPARTTAVPALIPINSLVPLPNIPRQTRSQRDFYRMIGTREQVSGEPIGSSS